MKNFLTAMWLCTLVLLVFACSSSDDKQTVDGDTELETDTISELEVDLEFSSETDVDQELSETITDGDTVENDQDQTEYAGQFTNCTPSESVVCLKFFFLPTTNTGQTIDLTFEAVGGVPPYSSWKIANGDAAHGNLANEPLGELPPGTSLDEDSGILSGTPNVEGFYYFAIQAEDSMGTVANDVYGIRIGDKNVKGTMAKKAKEFQEVYEARHIWNGFSLDVLQPDDPNGNYQLTTLGDATFVSGQCTMAMSFRHAVEQNTESLKTIKTLVDGWRFFQRLTGVPGLIGRSFFHKDDPIEDRMWDEWNEENQTRWIKGTGAEFEDFYWRSDTSRDQVTGAVLGVAMAYDMVDDPETKETAATFLTEFADHIWDHDLAIFDPDGKITTHGDISGERLEGWPIGNAQGASCLLAWFKIAYHASSEERFKTYYDELVNNRDYISILRDHEWTYMDYSTKWYNTYMSFENWFHLMRLEDDPELASQLRDIFRDTLWLNTDDKTPNRRAILEHNANKTPWYLYSTGTHDSEALFRVLWQMSVFPDAPLRDRAVFNSDDPTIIKNETGPKHEVTGEPLEALYALPINKRREDMVMWHRGPYLLDGGNDNGRERTGCDYLLPYWMGRYYGYINSEW